MQTVSDVLKKIAEYSINKRADFETLVKNEEAEKEKSCAYRAKNIEKQREYDRIKAREYRARKKAQVAATAQ